MDNLKLWDSVEKTNPLKTKNAKIGSLNITAINATSQIKRATELFGSFGNKWGLKEITYEYIDIPDCKLALVGGVFYYPDGEFPLHTSIKVTFITNGGKGYLKIDDDFMKKAETDLITKALSRLGFNADVFMGLYDDNRYVEQMKVEFSTNGLITDKQHQEIRVKFQNAGIDYQSACMDWSLKNFSELQSVNIDKIDEYIANVTSTTQN